MYSPKIDEDLIPHLYRLGKSLKKPMSTVVSDILRQYLDKIKVVESHKGISCMAAEKETSYEITKKGGE